MKSRKVLLGRMNWLQRRVWNIFSNHTTCTAVYVEVILDQNARVVDFEFFISGLRGDRHSDRLYRIKRSPHILRRRIEATIRRENLYCMSPSSRATNLYRVLKQELRYYWEPEGKGLIYSDICIEYTEDGVLKRIDKNNCPRYKQSKKK